MDYSKDLSGSPQGDKNQIIGKDAQVEYSAKIERSIIRGCAHIGGKAQIESSLITDNCSVLDAAIVIESELRGFSKVYDKAFIYGIWMEDNSCVFGDAYLVAAFTDEMFITLKGGCKFGGSATFEGLNTFDDFVRKYGEDKVALVEGEIVLTDVWDMG